MDKIKVDRKGYLEEVRKRAVKYDETVEKAALEFLDDLERRINESE